MYRVEEGQQEISFDFSSEQRFLDRVFPEAQAFLGSTEMNQQSIHIVLKELLENAIEHGNKKNQSKLVHCKLTLLGPDDCMVMVSDEGKGFAYQEILTQDLTQEGLDLSCGYPLIRKSVTENLEFNTNGNCVKAFITAPQGTRFSIIPQGQLMVVHPTGDIVDNSAEELRLILMGLYDLGHRNFCIDCSDMGDLDAMGLTVLAIFAQMLKQDGAKLLISNANPDLSNLFRLVHLSNIREQKAS